MSKQRVFGLYREDEEGYLDKYIVLSSRGENMVYMYYTPGQYKRPKSMDYGWWSPSPGFWTVEGNLANCTCFLQFKATHGEAMEYLSMFLSGKIQASFDKLEAFLEERNKRFV